MRQRIGRRLISVMLSVLMLVSLLPTAVFAEELPDQTTAGVTEQVGEGTGNTVKNSTENEDSTGGEEAKGESGTTCVAKVGDNEYTTLEDAIAAAEPDANGIITYEIYGKATVDSTGWVQVAKTGLTGPSKVEFVGKTEDAEICITGDLAILADQSYDIDVSFDGLTLSKLNPAYGGDYGHSTNYFTCWLRNNNQAENTVTYTNCTFPNGACNNQYGKTVFDNCEFKNAASGKYNLWNYGGSTEIKGSTFTGTRGIKTYNEGTLAVAPTVKIENTTFGGLTEKAAIVVSKATDVTLAGITATGCTEGLLQKDIEGGSLKTTIEANGTGISGEFNITATTTEAAAKEEFNITAGAFNGTVSKDYLAAGVKQDANGNIVENYVAKIGTVKYDTLDDAIKAVENGGTIVVNAGEYTLNGSLTYTGKAFTIKAADGMDVSFDMSKAVALHGAKITFEGVIFDYKTNGNYIGLQHTDTLVYNKCTINGMVFLYATNETFNSCTFEQTNKDAYNVWTYGAKNVEFNSCTFNCVGKSVLVYNEGTNTKTDLTVKDTKFIASAPVEGKAAIEIDTSLMKDGTTITVTGETTATGFAQGSNSKSTLWNDKKQTADTNKNTTVTVNGEEVFAPKIAEVGGVVYPSLEAAFAALSAKDHTLKLLNESVWDATTPVYWKAGDSEYTAAATLAAALTAAYKANAGDITIVCRPGADVGTMTHGHVADNITIYGNDAYISGGECDLEVDTYMFSRTTGKQGTTNGEYLTKDITINAYELDNLGVWGQRNTSHTINVNLTDCDGKAIEGKENVQRVYISNNSGVTSSVNNITLTGCNFLTAKTAVYSNANGAIVVDGCSFTGSKAPVNINHDGDGAVTVDVKNSTFTNCGDKGEWKNFAAPIRFVNSGSGTMKTTVDSCTFEGTVGKNGDILIGDGRAGKVSNDLSLTVKNTYGWVQAQKPGRYDGNKVDSGKRVETEVEKDVGLTTSVKSAFIKDTTGTRNDPYTLEQLSEMTRDEYIAAQKRLKGTMYVTVGNYEYDANGVLGNGVRNDTPGQVPDHSKLNSYAENGYLGEGNDDANGKNIVFVNGSITSNVYGYTSIDNIGTSLLLAVPAYTNVTFEGITFNNVMSFDYQLYTSPWSQLGELKFKNCVFEGIIVGAIAAQELTFDGCRFEDYENSKSENSSNPTWIRPAYGNWTKDDNEGQGTGFRSLTKITFTNNTVTSTRPVKFERIAQWEMATTVTATGNTFTINKVQSDTDTKNVGMYFGANAKFDLVVDNNKASGKTAGLYTAVYSAPNSTNYPGLPAGSTVKDANGNNIEKGVPALEWKSTKPLTLKTTEEVAQLTTTKGVVKFATLQEAIAEAKDGDTVKLLKDCSGNGIRIETKNFATKGLTVDFGGCTYTVGGVLVGSPGTGSNAFQLLEGGKVTFQNGTIAGVTEGTKPAEDTPDWHGAPAIVIQNYCDLTLKGMTVSGGDETVYTVSNNHGNVVIEDSTINAGKAKGYGYGPFAFDVCGYSTYDGVSVTVKGSSTINGDIEVSRSANNTKDVKLALESGTINGKLKIDSSIKIGDATTVTKGADVTLTAPAGYAWNTDGTLVEAVAQIGDVGYITLEAAIAAAASGDTVKLLKDVKEDVTIDKNITLDLGGKTLTNTGAGKATISVNNGVTATAKNGSVVGGTSFYNIQVGKAVNSTANLTLENVTATAGNTGSSMIDNWGTLTIESGTYTGGLNVVKSEEGSKLTINGGEFTLNHAVSNNYNGVILSAGMTKITDGEFIQNATTTPKRAHPTVVLAMKVDGYDSKIVITGGKFTNKKSGEKIFHGSGKATSDNFEVSGGTFNKSISDDYCAEGFIPTKNADGTYGVKEGAYVAKVDNVKYETLQEAFDAVTTEVQQTIVLLHDVTVTGTLKFDKTYNDIPTILKMQGHTITGEGCRALQIVNGHLRIEGRSNEDTASIITSTGIGIASSVIRVGENDVSAKSKQNLSLAMGVTVKTDCSYGIAVFGGGGEILSVENSKVISTANHNADYDGCAIATLGTDKTTASVTIKSGAVIKAEDSNAIYMPSGSLLVYGDVGNYPTVTGLTGIYAKSGRVTIKGANIYGTGVAQGYIYNGNGGVPTGDALVIDNCGYPNDKPTVSFGDTNAPNFVSANAKPIGSYARDGYTKVTGFVDKGTFNKAIDKDLLADGYVCKYNAAEGNYGVATTENCVAKVGDIYYATLQDAIDAAQNGATVVLVKDVDTPEVTYVIDKALTIDLAGYNITGSGYDGVFQIDNADAKVLIKNGNIVAVENTGSAGKYAMAVWACAADCEVTLENLNVSQKITHTDDKQMDMIYTSGGTIIINSGNFASGTPAWTLNCKDAAYKDGTANIIVNGGTFKGFDPMNGETEGKGTSFVAAGVGVDHVDGKFIAKSGMTAQVVDEDSKSVKAFEDLADALDAAAKIDGNVTVKMLNDVTSGVKYVDIESNVTLDLCGHSIMGARALWSSGDVIDSAANKGVVSAARYSLDKGNAYTPIYNKAKAGFSFFNLQLRTRLVPTDGTDVKTVEFKLDNSEAHVAERNRAFALLKDGFASSYVKARVVVSWTAKDSEQEQRFVFNDNFMALYCNTEAAQKFIVTFTGLNGIEADQVTARAEFVTYDSNGNEMCILKATELTLK